MEARDLLKRIRPLMRERLPVELREFHWEASFLAKLWYGNHDLHYEITPRERAHVIEIGLHFESDPLTNARLLAAFQANASVVRRALPEAKPEQWDRGWCRVWESLPYRRPDTALARELADRVAAYVIALEPILRRELPSDVAWAEAELPRPRVRAAATSRGSRAAR
jgi:hypothetical protein